MFSRSLRTLPDGSLDLTDLDLHIRPFDDPHQARTTLICVENTHNICGGRAVPIEFLEKVCHTIATVLVVIFNCDVFQLRKEANKYNIPVHMDGARLMNAAVSQNVPVSEILQYVDTVNMCFSKVL